VAALWEGDKLEVVDRELIPSIPKAKVLFINVIQGDQAVKLLQQQNPDVQRRIGRFCTCQPLPNEGGG